MIKKNRIKIGVIFGGRSGEHEVSIVSAQSVMKFLDKKKYDVIPIAITKQGAWLAGPQAVNLLKAGIKKMAKKSILAPDPTERGIINIEEKKTTKFLSKFQPQIKMDVIFPVLHGTYGEDGTIQGLMELANIPYIGANVLGSAVGMDKIIQKDLFKNANLPIVKYIWFLTKEWKKNSLIILRRIEKELKYPVFIKPVNLGSSVGISKANNKNQLKKAINLASQFDRKVIVEEGVRNVREIEVSVLGNDYPKASIAGEIIPSNDFYDYDAKYIDGKSLAHIPAKISKSIMQKIQTTAINAFKILDLCGMARVDFFLTKKTNKVYLNEVNTIPGFTSISMYPKLWEESGLTYPKLLDELIHLAIERHKEKNQLKTSFESGSDWYK